MKIISALLCLALLATGSLTAEEKPRPKKLEKELPGDVPIEKEIAAYYRKLIEEDEDVKQQQERLTARSRKKALGLFQLGDPYVVPWFPIAETRSNEGDTQHGHFLVFQTAGRWRTKDSETDVGLVSEFRVDLAESKVVIEFLGFRELSLRPVVGKK